jgi:3-oxoadipate enol-lactonase
MQLLPAELLRRQLVSEIPRSYRARTLEEIAPLRSRQLSRLMREAAGFEIDAAQIRAPTLVLCGERDKANLPLARELADGVPRSMLKLVPAAGHVANLDNPQAFTALVVEFLSSSASVSSS